MTGVPSISVKPCPLKNSDLEGEHEDALQAKLTRDVEQPVHDQMADAAPPDLRMHRHRADLAEVRPQHVQGAAAEQFAVDLGDPELLDRLVERHEVLLQQNAAGVDVDEFLDGGHVGGPGAPHHEPAGLLGVASLTAARGIRIGNRYSVAVPGQPHTDPVVPRARVANSPTS